MIDLNVLCKDLARFANNNGYVIELRINTRIENKINLYKNTVDTLPFVEYMLNSLTAFYGIEGSWRFCDRIVLYYDMLIFDITKL